MRELAEKNLETIKHHEGGEIIKAEVMTEETQSKKTKDEDIRNAKTENEKMTREKHPFDKGSDKRKDIRVFSFIRKSYDWVPIEVEISLLPGIPQFHIMGLPDSSLRESQVRILSALKHQGFSLVNGKQVLVNLRPHYVRKKSQGLDLAIACAYLWKTGQVKYSSQAFMPKCFVYGALGLDGDVEVPDDLDGGLSCFFSSSEGALPHGSVISGCPQKKLGFSVLGLKELRDLEEPEFYPASSFPYDIQRPSLPKNYFFSKEAADLLTIAGVGGHSLLIAGPAGSGKTHFCEALHYLLPEPRQKDMSEIQKIAKLYGREEPVWPPFVNPHHTTPPMSMLGGGDPPFPGELTRAHGGILFLDEFLNFHSEVKEALREPLEKGEITVARRGRFKTFPANFQFVAATNLCHCGKLTPRHHSLCHYSLSRCRSYLDRLSGPLLDRFEILSFSDSWVKNRSIPLEDILERVKRALLFAEKTRGQSRVNSKLKREQIGLSSFLNDELLPQISGSERRRLAFLKVARTIADIEQVKDINSYHTEKAHDLCCKPFSQIQRIFS